MKGVRLVVDRPPALLVMHPDLVPKIFPSHTMHRLRELVRLPEVGVNARFDAPGTVAAHLTDEQRVVACFVNGKGHAKEHSQRAFENRDAFFREGIGDVDELVLTEATPSKSPQGRTTQLTLHLLGPMHDRVHVLQYYGVRGYRLEAGMTARGHGDVLVHEVRLNELGVLVHEILFAAGARLVIECGDMRYEEHPLPRSRSGAA
jgi:hypothetical protein